MLFKYNDRCMYSFSISQKSSHSLIVIKSSTVFQEQLLKLSSWVFIPSCCVSFQLNFTLLKVSFFNKLSKFIVIPNHNCLVIRKRLLIIQIYEDKFSSYPDSKVMKLFLIHVFLQIHFMNVN